MDMTVLVSMLVSTVYPQVSESKVLELSLQMGRDGTCLRRILYQWKQWLAPYSRIPESPKQQDRGETVPLSSVIRSARCRAL